MVSAERGASTSAPTPPKQKQGTLNFSVETAEGKKRRLESEEQSAAKAKKEKELRPELARQVNLSWPLAPPGLITISLESIR